MTALNNHEHEVWMKTYEAELAKVGGVVGKSATQRADEALIAYRKYAPDHRTHTDSLSVIGEWLALYHHGQNGPRALMWEDTSSGPQIKLMLGANQLAIFVGNVTEMFDKAAEWCIAQKNSTAGRLSGP